MLSKILSLCYHSLVKFKNKIMSNATDLQSTLVSEFSTVITNLINTRNAADADKKIAQEQLQAALDKLAANDAIVVANNAQLQALLQAATLAQPEEVEPTTPEAV